MLGKIKTWFKTRFSRKAQIIGVDIATQPDKTAITEIKVAFDKVTYTSKAATEATKSMTDAFTEYNRRLEREKRQSANNWRKLHGLPMRRRIKVRKS